MARAKPRWYPNRADCELPSAFIGAAGGLSTSIAIHFVSHFSEFQKFEIAVIFWLVAAAVGDVFITVALTKYLVSVFFMSHLRCDVGDTHSAKLTIRPRRGSIILAIGRLTIALTALSD